MTTKKIKNKYPLHPELRGLTAEQRKLYEQIRDLYRSHCLEEATKRYQIGKLVAKCLADERTYGERVVVKISIALGISHQTLYRWSRVTDIIGSEAFAEMMKKRTRHGNRLSWTHVEMLSHARGPTEVNRFLNLVLEEDYSSDDLRELINESLPIPPRKQPKPLVPRSPLGGLRALSRQAADIAELCSVFDETVTNPLLSTEIKKIQPGVLEELKNCEAELVAMIETATDQLESVRDCIQGVEAGLTEQAEAKEALKKAKAAHGRERLQKATAA